MTNPILETLFPFLLCLSSLHCFTSLAFKFFFHYFLRISLDISVYFCLSCHYLLPFLLLLPSLFHLTPILLCISLGYSNFLNKATHNYYSATAFNIKLLKILKCNVCSEMCTPLHAQCCAIYLVLKWYTGMALYVIDIYLPLISESGVNIVQCMLRTIKKCENFCVKLYSLH